MQLYFMERRLDVARLVLYYVEPHPDWKQLTNGFQTSLNVIDHIHGVGVSLAPQLQNNGENAVVGRERTLLFVAVFDVTNIANSDQCVSNPHDYQIVELLRLEKSAERTEHEFACAFVYPAAGNF